MGDVKTLPDFSLTYKSFDSDQERYVSALIKRKSEFKRNKRVSYDSIATDEVFNAYARKKLWSKLAHAYTPVSHFAEDYPLKISRELVKLNNLALLKRMWEPYLQERKSMFWDHVINRAIYVEHHETILKEESFFSNPDYLSEVWPKIREEAIGAFSAYAKLLKTTGADNELVKVTRTLASIKSEERDFPVKKKAKTAKMDEALFWRLISSAIKSGDDSTEIAVDVLTDRLEAYKSTEIKQFQRLLLDKLEELNTWDAWALVYLAHDGCSEDSFLEFRYWTIFQGKRFCNYVTKDIHKAMRYMPADEYCFGSNLTRAAEIAYYRRSNGKALSLRKKRYGVIRGEPWDDKSIEERFPKVADYFS